MSIDCIAFAKATELGEAESAQARLLFYVIAENTFNDSFVCLLSQEQLAYEAGRVSVRTIRRTMQALVDAGLLLRRERFAVDGGGRMPDAVRIRGFKPWYLANHGRPPERPLRKTKPANLSGLRVGGKPANLSGSNRPICPGQTGQQVSGPPGQQVSGIEEPVLTRTLPPNPHAVGGPKVDEDLKGKAAPLLAALVADGVALGVVETLLRPVLEQRRFSAADRLGELRHLRDAAKGLPGPALAKAAQSILAASNVAVKPERIAAAIAAAKKAGAMVVIRKGTAQWQRWAEHFATTDAKQAGLMDRFTSWQVRSEWPPATSTTTTGERAA